MIFSTFVRFGLQVALVLATSDCPSPDSHPTATIDSGMIMGTAEVAPDSGSIVHKFLGIPFAEPPIRFAPPVPVKQWQNILLTKELKPSCVQRFNNKGRDLVLKLFNNPPPPAGESEDCLHINVWAPGTPSEKPIAVLLWFFGGNFDFGTGTLPLYDGTSFAANQDVVLVTFNYRSTVFGFPGNPDTPKSERNLGFLDQRLAVDWVQRNIAVFGGDPKKVTIFGESAGGGSIDSLIHTTANPPPFRAAIMQSGQSSVGISSLMPMNSSSKSWELLVKDMNCTSNPVECLRNVPATDLKNHLEANAGLNFRPEKDGGATWADQPRADLARSTEKNSTVAQIPIMIGHNADEASNYPLGDLKFDTIAATVAQYLGDDGPKVLEKLTNLYAKGTPGISTEDDQIRALMEDAIMHCNSKAHAEEFKAAGLNSWRYYYNGSFPCTDPLPNLGSYHSGEISLLFETYAHDKATEFQKELNRVLQKAWADFAKDPRAGPGWSQTPAIGVFSVGNGDALEVVHSEALDERCAAFVEVWEKVGDGVSSADNYF